MAEDIAPELLKKIQDMFRSGIDQDQRVAELKEKLDAGSATYHEAHEYASLVGGHMKDAYMEYLTSDNLPDGKCYYNIAERIIGTTEHEQYELVSQYAQEVQTALNKNAGIVMKAQAAGEDTTRVEGLVNVASNADQYDRVAKTVAQGVESMAREVVDRSVEKNAGFQRQSGLRPKIIRSSGGKCCDWCSSLVGTYDYDKAPKEIYARHNNCTCTVEYDPGSGRRQDVWSKRWISEGELAKREELKTLGLDNLSGSDKIEVRKEMGLESKPRASAKANGVEYNEVFELPEKLSTQDIIKRVGGGDMTKGSCQSVALAYVGNQSGWDVLDYRGGISRDVFSRTRSIVGIAELPGVDSKIIKEYNDFKAVNELLKTVEEGKEYLLATGKHTAIIRKTANGYEFLELQSPIYNGFLKLDNKALRKRFECSKTHTTLGSKVELDNVLIDTESLYSNEEFRKILGYINTSPGEQKKGAKGYAK